MHWWLCNSLRSSSALRDKTWPLAVIKFLDAGPLSECTMTSLVRSPTGA